jgi:hypothetical protein
MADQSEAQAQSGRTRLGAVEPPPGAPNGTVRMVTGTWARQVSDQEARDFGISTGRVCLEIEQSFYDADDDVGSPGADLFHRWSVNGPRARADDDAGPRWCCYSTSGVVWLRLEAARLRALRTVQAPAVTTRVAQRLPRNSGRAWENRPITKTLHQCANFRADGAAFRNGHRPLQ